MNTDAIEKVGIKPLDAILTQNGGWPMAMEPIEWNQEEFSWTQIHDYYTQLANISPLYKISIDTDSKKIVNASEEVNNNEKIKIIKLYRPNLPTVLFDPNESFDRQKIYDDGSYAKFIVQVAKIFAKEREASVDEEQLEKDAQDIIKMEKLIDNNTIKNYTIVHFTLQELQDYYDEESQETKYSKINWKKMFMDLFSIANIHLDGSEIVSVVPFKFFKTLSNIFNEINPRTIVNYLHWHFLSNMLPYTYSRIQELIYEFKKKEAGVKEETPRWRTCVKNVGMKDAISYMFVRTYFQDKMKMDTEKMISSMKNAMTKHILKADWLDDSIRKMAFKKLKNLQHNVGYPNWYNNVTAVNNFYRGLPIGQDFFTNILSQEKFSLKQNLRRLHSKPKANVWFLKPIVVNAVYLRNANAMTIPAADFQLPLFTPEQIEAINYGALGMVLAHEMSHGFDDSGIEYDSDGNKIKWPTEIKEAYDNRAKCFVNQFNDLNNFNKSIEEDSPENIGKMKLSENIADTLGIDISFDAFEILEKQKKQARLPGFEDITSDQLFFLSFAKLYCENATPAFESMAVNYDTHSSGRYRVTASLKNSEGFAKSFNCHVESSMNPKNKCKLWK